MDSEKFDNQSDWIWILDPLDGTKDFIQGTGNYAMHLALNYKQKPYLGFVLIIPFLSFVKFLLSTLYNDDSIATKYLSFSLGIILFRMAFSDVLVIMLISLALIYLCKIRVRV